MGYAQRVRTRARDWAVALSVAAVLGVLLGGVYSGVTGWAGPSGRGVTATAADSRLPMPGERASSPAATSSPETAGRSAAMRTAASAAGEAEPAKTEEAKVKAPKEAAAKHPGKPRPGKHGDD